MRLAEAFCSALPITEDHYTHTVGYTQRDPRAFFLYGCMDEVYKSSTAILQWAEFLDAPEDDQKAHNEPAQTDARLRHMKRVVTDRVLDEQHMWVRKLTEILTDLILFAATDEQDYYRIYLGCRWLDAYLGLQADFVEFFGSENANASVSIAHAVRVIESAQQLVDTSRIWFLKAAISSQRVPRAGGIFRSARQRYKQAVLLATADQKLALGVSYEMGHSMPSRAIHPSVGAPTRDEGLTASVDGNIGRISLLAAHTVVAAFKISSVEPSDATRQIMTTFVDPGIDERFHAVHHGSLEVGDIVAAYSSDSVCEIIDRTTTKYGYTSYKVRVLLRPMLEEIQVDWYPSQYVHLLVPRRQLRESLREACGRMGIRSDEITEARLSELLPGVLAEMEKAGRLPGRGDSVRGGG